MSSDGQRSRGVSRRQFLAGAGAAGLATLAGCISQEAVIKSFSVDGHPEDGLCRVNVHVNSAPLNSAEVVVLQVGNSAAVLDEDTTWSTTVQTGAEVLIFRAAISGGEPVFFLLVPDGSAKALRSGYINADCEYVEVSRR